MCVVSFSTNDTHFDTRVKLTFSRVSFSCSSTHSGKLGGSFSVCVVSFTTKGTHFDTRAGSNF